MNFLEFLITLMFGLAIGVLLSAVVLEDKVVTINELNRNGYSYNKYHQVIDGVETNWISIIKR